MRSRGCIKLQAVAKRVHDQLVYQEHRICQTQNNILDSYADGEVMQNVFLHVHLLRSQEGHPKLLSHDIFGILVYFTGLEDALGDS